LIILPILLALNIVKYLAVGGVMEKLANAIDIG
jgi:hypothetical protein